MNPNESDEIEQQLQSGWELLEAGDLPRARNVAEKLLGQEELPEAHLLAGAIAAASGQVADAIGAYERALRLDPHFTEAMLLLAELLADEDLPAARKLLDRALDAAEEEDEYLQVLLCKAELELRAEDGAAARQLLAEIPPVELACDFELRIGRLELELGQFDEAERHFRIAEEGAEDDFDVAEATYGLGLVAEARGDQAARTRHFQRVLTLDSEAPTRSLGLSSEELEQLVGESLGELPARARELIVNVPIVVEERPTDEQVREGFDPRLLGLFSGVPTPEAGAAVTPRLESITLFLRNLEQAVQSSDELRDEIRRTLLDETSHFFGMTHEQLESGHND